MSSITGLLLLPGPTEPGLESGDCLLLALAAGLRLPACGLVAPGNDATIMTKQCNKFGVGWCRLETGPGTNYVRVLMTELVQFWWVNWLITQPVGGRKSED